MIPHAARFTIRIDGFRCGEPVSNGLSDHGDDVWLAWHGTMFNRDGPVGPRIQNGTVIHGHRGHSRVRIQSGSRTREGGIWRDDVVTPAPGPLPPLSGGLPVEAATVTLTHGDDALVFVPTIWRAHGDGHDGYRVVSRWDQLMGRMAQATAQVQSWVSGRERSRFGLRSNFVIERDWWEMVWFSTRRLGAPIPDGCDRPIGCTADGDLGLFPPNVVVLNYATALALQQPPGRLTGRGSVHVAPGRVECPYEDRGAAGAYTFLMSVIGLTAPWLSPQPPPTDFSLGRLWRVREGEWTGVWTRRGPSTVFDAEWVHTSGERVRDIVEVERIDGTAIEITRASLNGLYRGEIGSDVRSVSGTATWYAPEQRWTATIAV